jgi:hypothetical protein
MTPRRGNDDILTGERFEVDSATVIRLYLSV